MGAAGRESIPLILDIFSLMVKADVLCAFDRPRVRLLEFTQSTA